MHVGVPSDEVPDEVVEHLAPGRDAERLVPPDLELSEVVVDVAHDVGGGRVSEHRVLGPRVQGTPVEGGEVGRLILGEPHARHRHLHSSELSQVYEK